MTVKVPDKDKEKDAELADQGGLAVAQHVRIRHPRRREALARRRAAVPARRVPVPAAERRRRLDLRRKPRRRAEAGRGARLQPVHGRRAGVEAAVDGHGRAPGARAARTRPARRPRAASAVPQVVPPDDLPAQLTKVADRRRDGEDPAAGVRAATSSSTSPGTAGAHLRRRRATAPCSRSRSAPAFAGTPTGLCVLQSRRTRASRRSSIEQQKFTYPFFLRQ